MWMGLSEKDGGLLGLLGQLGWKVRPSIPSIEGHYGVQRALRTR